MGLEIKTWENIKSFDDIPSDMQKRIILELEDRSQRRCLYLQREGRFFYYCGFDLSRAEDKKPTPTNPIYKRRVETEVIQLHCMSSFETCCIYSKKLKW